ncbi:GNAT family N-acetyltransferase [Streptomyces osmaniensis]|uniref:GNAT family protein n=1 Tax=Streptomyces osmaniensis TaxID=593134 RepID=A0ABP6Z0M5_9ACTN|nr:GNAT family N-acetyltransferase [Streptomyces sp. JCM17656]
MRLPSTIPAIPTLTADGICLRAPRQDDVEVLVRAFNDDQVRRFMPVPPNYTAADAQRFVDSVPRAWQHQERAIFVIADAATDNCIGEAELLSFNTLYDSAEIALLLDAPARRLRTSAAALRLLCRFGFEHLELGRIEAFADFENRAVHYLGLFVGFRHEGTARAKFPCPDGERRDAVVAALLPGDLA